MADLPLIHFLDFEGSRRSGVVEFGWATAKGDRIIDAGTALCAPEGGSIASEETAVHHLRPEDVADQPPFRTHWDTFAHLRETGLLAAHHAPVENSFLKQVWPYPRTSPAFDGTERQTTDWAPWIDTRRLAENLYPSLVSSRLGDLIPAFRLEQDLAMLADCWCPAHRRKPHCALYDALASALLFFAWRDEPAFRHRDGAWWLHQSRPSAPPGRQDELRI
ncbi:MAG: exonuclease domain-containing protein [Opitutales bacterium]